MLRGFLQFIAIVGVTFFAVVALFFLAEQARLSELSYDRPPVATSTLSQARIASSTPTAASSTPKQSLVRKALIKAKNTQPASVAESQKKNSDNTTTRLESPYSYAQKVPDTLNEEVRGALVNIFCETTGGPLSAVSGSGIIIDSRGVILTNAHVAQYVLLSTRPEIALNCTIRTGSPALSQWKADILYMPPSWVRDHAADIVKSRPKGTGENDYALLLITKSVNGSPLPSQFPFISPDTREAIAFTSDTLFLAGYPAEFAGGSATRSALYPSSVYTKVGDLLTFADKTVDLISLGSVALAQSGSSGGAAVNLWGRLVGLISTTSEGLNTADRELRAITLSYISRDLREEIGLSLPNLLEDDVISRTQTFMQNDAPILAKQIIASLENR